MNKHIIYNLLLLDYKILYRSSFIFFDYFKSGSLSWKYFHLHENMYAKFTGYNRDGSIRYKDIYKNGKIVRDE